jgi:hypothetical protein
MTPACDALAVTDDLDRLAAEGRRRAEAQQRGAATRGLADANAGAAQARRQVRASVSSYARWGWWLLGAIGAVLLIWLLPRCLPASWTHDDGGGEGGDPATGVAMLAGAALFVVLFVLRGPIGNWAVARERAWIESLPFALHRYLEALGNTTTEGTFVVILRFSEAMPDDALLGDALRAVGTELAGVRASPERLVERSFDFGESSVLTNAHVRRWLRGHLFGALLAIHARFPLRQVEVRGFR